MFQLRRAALRTHIRLLGPFCLHAQITAFPQHPNMPVFVAVLTTYKVDVLHIRLTELHAAHQNLPPAILTLRVKQTIQNIHQNQRNLTIVVRT